MRKGVIYNNGAGINNNGSLDVYGDFRVRNNTNQVINTSIFPIVGSWTINPDYQNVGGSYTIRTTAKRSTGDDVLTVNGDIGT